MALNLSKPKPNPATSPWSRAFSLSSFARLASAKLFFVCWSFVCAKASSKNSDNRFS